MTMLPNIASPSRRSASTVGILMAVLLLMLYGACQGAQAADRLVPLESRQVKVGGTIGERIQLTVKNNLLALDIEKGFLRSLRQKDRGSLVGLGMLIDASVGLAAYTGDERALVLKKHLIEETIKEQEPDGYIGLLQPKDRMWKLWDIHAMGYIIYALAADHRLFGEKPSLEAAGKLADYVIRRWSAQPDGVPGQGLVTVNVAVTGIESAMLALHRETGERRYVDFVVNHRKLPEWEASIICGRWGQLEGHAYSHCCRCVAQLRLHRLQPDERLVRSAHDLIDFLLRQNGLVITGTAGDHECWHDTQEGTENLAETCATAYLIRLCDELLRLEGETLYGDLMERAIYNGLFAAQSPDGRSIRYYTPFDGPRRYSPFAPAKCCPNNYRRIITELPTTIYYQQDGGPVINLYSASQTKFSLDDGLSLTLRQETDYPRSGRIVVHLDPSRKATFPLRLRIPRWCNEARISGVTEPISGGRWYTLTRTWKPGDQVKLEMSMPLRLVKGRVAQAGRVAVMRGPTLFCLSRKQNEALAHMDLRLIAIDPTTLEGPIDNPSGDGLACRVKAWKPGAFYPIVKPTLSLVLTEFTDPGGEAVYFKVPNPYHEQFVDDELIVGHTTN